MPLKRENW